MLEAETKRRIDEARDILVGKVPDPKSQVEQITIALIYKFMDDMDKESISMGGNPSFFVGEYEKYSWTKIFNPRLGGYEMLSLYSEAITRLSQNPSLPALFRDIFKSAYLPYRDPETLKLFLKTINDFVYDHSERLGDAYEYLLAILGSQGDAGQFLTPRHIINFMVQVVDPKKDETILDPACGTAGFLISAYRHILQKNTDKTPGDLFTIDEIKRLVNNIKGYDIAPDMVRLSLVNMYLHGFTNPQISEYDTLTSEDKWGEYADVILANPPFMTPKGGIKPHKKFSVQSNRSEVLFVDYIAEHLTPNGRAAVIVPEGVIFQSGKAYKQLRKELVEKYLWAVVSLPSGVFKPYSGVKTSILFVDRAIVKKRNSILFIKVENDGFDLGDQRRKINTDDLPKALNLLNRWKASPNIDLSRLISNDDSLIGVLEVKRSEIIQVANHNLTMNRYIVSKNPSTDRKFVELGKILEPSKALKAGNRDYPIMSITMKSGLIDQNDRFKKRIASVETDGYKVVKKGELVVGFPIDEGVLGFQSKYECALVSPAYGIWKIKEEYREALNTKYLELILRSDRARELYRSNMQGSVSRRRSIPKEIFLQLRMPIPPLEVQKEIVTEIEEYQKIIDGARQVVENWKPRIDVDPEWPLTRLGDICRLQYGYTASANPTGNVRFIRITDINMNGTLKLEDPVYIELNEGNQSFALKKGDLLVARTGASFGKTLLFEYDFLAVFASYLIRLDFDLLKMNPLYYWLFSQTDDYWKQAKQLVTGGGQPQFNANSIKKILIPTPSLQEQEKIISCVMAERTIINSNIELIELYAKRKDGAIEKAMSIS